MTPDGGRRTALLLGLLVVAVVAPFVQLVTAQPASRYAFTAGLVERQTVELDDYDAVLQVDRIERDGHVYSDKAPGQPVVAAPLFAAAKLVGAEDGTVVRLEENLGVWWITLWFAVLPAAGLAALMYLRAARHRPEVALPAALSLSFATLLLPFASELYAHVLVAFLGYLAWHLVASERVGPARLLVAGTLVGFATASEYPMALLAVVLGGYLVWRGVRWQLAWYALGGVPWIGLLLGYQVVAFGGLLETSYAQKGGGQGSIVGRFLPDPGHLVQVIAGSRGLIFTPIVLLAVWAAVKLAREPSPDRAEAVVALIVVGLFVVLQASWVNPWGGEMPGPRYVIPALPFLAVPAAHAWSRWRTAAVACTGIGVVSMGLALITVHLVPDGGAAIVSHVENLRTFGVTPTVFTMAIGPAGWIVHAAIVVIVARLLVSADRETRAAIRPSREARA